MSVLQNTRRRFLMATAGTVVAAITLAGCSSPTPGAGSTPTPRQATTSLLPTAEGKTTYPLKLTTPFGDTVLDKRPERIAIVTASTVDTDALIALGATPVFAPSTVERNPWLNQATVTSIEKLWKSEAGAEVSAESIAAAKPDLIVNLYAYATFDQNRFTQLSAIAPVLYAPADELTWQEVTQKLGDTIDLSTTATKVVTDAEKTVTEVKKAHPEFAGKTAAHVIVYEKEYGATYASAPGSDTARLFEQLGFTLPPAAEKFTEDGTISDELVGLIDADFLLVSTFKDGTGDYFTDSALFRQVPAVAEGRVVINPGDQESGINYFAWGLNVQSAVSVPWLVNQLAEFGDRALR